jgi:hypothetical protein
MLVVTSAGCRTMQFPIDHVFVTLRFRPTHYSSFAVSPTDIEPETSIRHAVLFQRRFPGWGRYGLSAFYARSDDEVLDLGEDRLDAFETLFVYLRHRRRRRRFRGRPDLPQPARHDHVLR